MSVCRARVLASDVVAGGVPSARSGRVVPLFASRCVLVCVCVCLPAGLFLSSREESVLRPSCVRCCVRRFACELRWVLSAFRQCLLLLLPAGCGGGRWCRLRVPVLRSPLPCGGTRVTRRFRYSGLPDRK